MPSPTDLPSQLSPILSLLDAFNHRNRNQHRRSAWWQQFNLFRRAVRKLSSPRHYATSSVSRQKQVGRGLDAAARDPGAGADIAAASPSLLHHIKWVAGNVIHPSYIAFTQLTADNQYAPLGLVLLGILARFNSIISPFLPPPSKSQPRPVTNTAAATTTKLSRRPHSLEFPDTRPSEQDFGVTVSRSEFAVSPPLPDIAEAGSEEKPKKRAKVSPIENRTQPTPSLTIPDAVPEAKTQKLKKKKEKEKKKKKQTSGTDLSDLFDSIA